MSLSLRTRDRSDQRNGAGLLERKSAAKFKCSKIQVNGIKKNTQGLCKDWEQNVKGT
jgi:hypothetical protein